MRTYSIIFIARAESDCHEALTALARLRYPEEGVEVLVATGRNPSEQRNQAAIVASGDYLLFLDDDSLVDPRLLHYFDDALAYEPGINIVGGPSIYESTASSFKTAVQAVFVSVFGLGPFRSRYMSLGPVQRSTEEKLILCNMIIERKFFRDERGFNANLYPNEENEFLNRVQNKTKIYYHPLARCHREPRATWLAFFRQMMSYGEGRARDLSMFPNFWNYIFAVPLLFVLYGVSLLVAALTCTHLPFVFILPFAIYVLFNLCASVFAFFGTKRFRVLLRLPFLFFICHFAYGLGLLTGFVKHPFTKARPKGEIKVFQVKRFAHRWPDTSIGADPVHVFSEDE